MMTKVIAYRIVTSVYPERVVVIAVDVGTKFSWPKFGSHFRTEEFCVTSDVAILSETFSLSM